MFKKSSENCIRTRRMLHILTEEILNELRLELRFFVWQAGQNQRGFPEPYQTPCTQQHIDPHTPALELEMASWKSLCDIL